MTGTRQQLAGLRETAAPDPAVLTLVSAGGRTLARPVTRQRDPRQDRFERALAAATAAAEAASQVAVSRAMRKRALTVLPGGAR